MKHEPTEWIFITGATRGMGRVTAEYLASKGYRVIATGRNIKSLNELQDRANEEGWSLHAWQMDVTKTSDIQESARAALELTQGTGIDVLVNNAGYGQSGFLLDIPKELMQQQFEVNVFSVLEVTKAFAPQLLSKRGRKIINISSVVGKMPVPWMGIYSASKFAIEALSDVLRNELHPFGVKVVIVEPGSIATSFHGNTIESMRSIPQESSLYAPVYQWLKDTNYKAFYTMPAGSPMAVARTIHKIVKKRNPKRRYVVPLQARLFLKLYQLLPSWLVDRITRRTFHLHEPLVPPDLRGTRND